MTLPLFTRRLALAAALVLGVASCGGGEEKAGGAPGNECMMPRLLSPKTPRIVSGLLKRWSLAGDFFP